LDLEPWNETTVRVVTIWQIGMHLAYFMQDVHNIYSTDVVIINQLQAGRARIRSASLKTTKRLGFHKEKEVCQHSYSSKQVPIHNTHNMLQYIAVRNILVCQSKCIELYCTMSYCNIATY